MENTLKKLYDENIDSLYRYAYFKLNSSEEDVFDIIQESFYKLGVELSKWKKIDNLKAYIYRIVSNKIIDFYKKNKDVSLEENFENLEDELYEKSDIERTLDAKLEVEKIYHILAWFDTEDKDIFLLRYLEELTPKEIADIYKKDVNAITVKLHRIKTKIKKQIQYYNN